MPSLDTGVVVRYFIILDVFLEARPAWSYEAYKAMIERLYPPRQTEFSP